MNSNKESDMFQVNEFFWKIFGLWPGRTPVKYYKFYSLVFITTFTIAYNVLLTVNLVYTPRNLEAFIEEGTFFFTEIAVMAKITFIIWKRDEILNMFKLIDSDDFKASDDIGNEIIEKNNSKYALGWKLYCFVSNFSYFTFIIYPIIAHLFMNKDIDLPIANYYFLSEEIKEKYFSHAYIYQSIGIYAHMTYNINVDSYIAGLLMVGITQLKVLNHNFSTLKFNSDEIEDKSRKSQIMILKLNKLLRHYDTIIRYCYDIQQLISVVMFMQFCMSSAIICVSMFGLLMVSSMSVLYGMISYLCAMTLQIFIPGWLGTQLGHESQELVHAAFNSDWILQSESYKRSIRLFIGRANIPIVITGLKMFPLLLGTFISIMKMAYSFFALLRNVQDR